MKTKSKALLLMLCAVLLVAASVLGTMAYLTAQDSVTNTFTVGNVSLGDGELQKGLDEAKVDEYGKPIENEARVQANEYKLLPGHTYTKDPTIHVAEDSEDCYLFVKVVDEIADIEAEQTVAQQMAAKGWTPVDDVANVFVYTADGHKAAVEGGTDVVVFESFKIKDDVANDTLATYAGKTIVVTAYAVQADGFEYYTAAEIWEAAFGTTNA